MNILELQKEENKFNLYLPETIEMANNLIQAFIKKNNIVALKLAIILSGARKRIRYVDNKVTFEVKELCSLMNIDKPTLKRNLKYALETKFTFVTKDKRVGETVPIHTYIFDRKSINVEIEISSLAKEIFTELQKGSYSFAKDIDPINLLSLKHKHSIRMALLLEQILNYSENFNKITKLTLEELNGYFGVNYRNYYDFEKKILIPVKEELDSNSKMTFEYTFIDEKIKKGRPKITSVEIKVKTRTSYQGDLFKTEIPKEIQQPAPSQEQELKITPDLFTELRLKYDTYLHSEDDEKNFMKYLKDTMKEFKDYAIKNDLELSEKRFKTWVQNAENDMIGFFYPYR